MSAPSAAAEVVPSVTGWTPSYFLDGDLGRCGPLRCPDWALLRVLPAGLALSFLPGSAGLASSGSSDLVSEVGSPAALAVPDWRWDLVCRLGCCRLATAASSAWAAAVLSLLITVPSGWAARPALFRPLTNLRSYSLRSRPLAT